MVETKYGDDSKRKSQVIAKDMMDLLRSKTALDVSIRQMFGWHELFVAVPTGEDLKLKNIKFSQGTNDYAEVTYNGFGFKPKNTFARIWHEKNSEERDADGTKIELYLNNLPWRTEWMCFIIPVRSEITSDILSVVELVEDVHSDQRIRLRILKNEHESEANA